MYEGGGGFTTLFDTKVSSSISGVQAASFHVTLKRFIQLFFF